MLNAELRVTSGKQAGNVIPLVSGRFLIGREEDCHLRPGNDLVSRHHCVFKTDEFTVRVRDLGSTNGTFVNGERLRGEVMLNSGDSVKVGTLEFEVVIKEGAAVSAEAEAADVPATIDGEPDAAQTMIQPTGPEADAAAMLDTAAFQGDTVYQQPTAPQFDPQQPQPVYGQPHVGYQMPYPQQPYPYGQPYGMPMGYPQQPMPYPPMYPQQPMMPQQTPPPPSAEPEPPAGKQAPSVSLPDPSQTGAKPPEPPEPPAPDSQGTGQSNQGAVSNTAMDIIKQYTQRRPGGQNK